MRSVYLLLSLLIFGNLVRGQHVYTITADSVKLLSHDSAELVIENHTQGIPGFLFNTGNGRTVFRRALLQLDESTYLLGTDTLRAMRSAYWQAAGNNIFNNNSGNVGIHRTSPNAMLDLPGPVSIDDSSAYRINYHPVLRLGGWIDTDYNSGQYVGSYTNLYTGDSAGANNTRTYTTVIGNGTGVNNSGNNNAFLGYGAGHDNVGDANTFLGYLSGRNNSTDSSGNASGYNTFLGIQSGQNNTGSGNTFLGNNTGYNNYGSYNTYGGEYAGGQGYGNYNVFWGEYCGNSSRGDNNTFLGYSTGYDNNGNGNLMIGAQIFGGTGYNNLGDNNIFLGSSEATDSRGDNNIMVGYGGGSVNQGNCNLFMGSFAGDVSQGDSNIYIGYNAGESTNGSKNISIGSFAGWDTDGPIAGGYSDNLFIGSYAGSTNPDGLRNTFIGSNSGRVGGFSIGNTCLGYVSGYFLNSRFTTGENENVCIGDSTAWTGDVGNYNIFLGAVAGFQSENYTNYNVTVGGHADYNGDNDGSYNVFLGARVTEFGEEDGRYNTFLGSQAGTECNVRDGVTLIGGLSNGGNEGTDISDATAIGYNAVVNNSNTMVFGDTATKTWLFGIYSTGGSPVSGAALVVGNNSTNGNGAYLTTGGVWTNASDQFKKENFESLNSTEILEKIAALPITCWNYKGLPARHIGPVAQDFYRIFSVGENDKTISTIDPSGIALLGVQGLYHQDKKALHQGEDQQLQISRQQSRLVQQQEQLTRLRSGLEQQKVEIEHQQEQMKQLLEKLNKLERSL